MVSILSSVPLRRDHGASGGCRSLSTSGTSMKAQGSVCADRKSAAMCAASGPQITKSGDTGLTSAAYSQPFDEAVQSAYSVGSTMVTWWPFGSRTALRRPERSEWAVTTSIFLVMVGCHPVLVIATHLLVYPIILKSQFFDHTY